MSFKKTLIFNEKFHDNCHDYLKYVYLDKYANKKYLKFLEEIKKNIPIIPICHYISNDLYKNIIVCDQHAVIFGYWKDFNPILATYALNACIGLVMYLPYYKIGCVAHIDGLPGYSNNSAISDGIAINFDPIDENLKIILSFVTTIIKNYKIPKNTSPILIHYYLIGGIFDLSEVMIYDIINAISKIDNYEYKFILMGRNLLGPENQSRNICIETRTGNISYFDYIENLEFYKNNTDENGLPMNIIKAPRKSEAMLDITYVPIVNLID